MPTDSVRSLFPQLVSRGWTPLPNRDKACMLPGWPAVEVDAAQAHRWSRQTRWPAIGLRVEPPLLVLDYDLPHPEIARAIRDITPRAVLEGALERVGHPPKVAFFLRMDPRDEPFYRLSTFRYAFIGEAKPTFAVEAFSGGGGGKQFGAFGPHSHDESGAVLRTYAWIGGRSPATVSLNELPVLRRAEVAEHLDTIDPVLARWPGLVRDENSVAGESQQQDSHDLTEDSVFHDVEGNQYTFAEVCKRAQSLHELKQENLRLTGSFTGDPRSTGSPRCKVFWSERTGLSIVDFKTGITHRPVLNTDDPAVQQMFDEIFNNNKKGGGT
jgi:hypothetical protein